MGLPPTAPPCFSRPSRRKAPKAPALRRRPRAQARPGPAAAGARAGGVLLLRAQPGERQLHARPHRRQPGGWVDIILINLLSRMMRLGRSVQDVRFPAPSSPGNNPANNPSPPPPPPTPHPPPPGALHKTQQPQPTPPPSRSQVALRSRRPACSSRLFQPPRPHPQPPPPAPPRPPRPPPRPPAAPFPAAPPFVRRPLARRPSLRVRVITSHLLVARPSPRSAAPPPMVIDERQLPLQHPHLLHRSRCRTSNRRTLSRT